tara:strand:+ start:178 stop:510 length:333 start_codon:yes stop_codon:yes gene_type:complete
MRKSFDGKILEEANSWIKSNEKVVLATVIQTWGSSPFQIGSKMIVNDKGNFLGSVSGGCIEANVISECLALIKNKIKFKKLEFKIANENAWNAGLACGGELTIFIEQINS